jgi:hypothetical protein
MRAFVFTDPSLARHAGQFVWLAIDTEKPGNAPVRQKLPIPALPSYFVVDPQDESVILRWVGGATVPQLHEMLDHAETEYARHGPPEDQVLARADRLYGEGKSAEAARTYQEALAQAPPDWTQYSRAVESLLFALEDSGGEAACARLAREAFPRLRHGPSAANIAASGLSCALSLPPGDRERATLVAALEADSREVAADLSLPVAADDRSALLGMLVDARHDAGDEQGAKRAAAQWAAFLEGEAAKAKNPDERAVFDSHRLGAYIEMGQPERAIPMLQASERDLPNDYNPPARLAIAYAELKRWDEALAASDRALAKVYGPRRLSYLRTRADIYSAKGDSAAARRTLEQAIQIAEALPPGQRSPITIAALQKKLATIQ